MKEFFSFEDIVDIKKEEFSINEVTLLSEEDISESGVIRRLGLVCPATDFARLTGVRIFDMTEVSFEEPLKNRAGLYYMSSYDEDGEIKYIKEDGFEKDEDDELIEYDERYNISPVDIIGLRPVMGYENLESLNLENVNTINNVVEIELGEFPQYAAPAIVQRELTTLYKRKNLKKTGRKYTIPIYCKTCNFCDFLYDGKFTESCDVLEYGKFTEYSYNGKKYVNVLYGPNKEEVLSNGENQTQLDNNIWIETSPIKWFVDEKNKKLISKNILFGYGRALHFLAQFEKGSIKKDPYYGFSDVDYYGRYINIGNKLIKCKEKKFSHLSDKEKFKNSYLHNYLNTKFVKAIGLKNQKREVEVLPQCEDPLEIIKQAKKQAQYIKKL